MSEKKSKALISIIVCVIIMIGVFISSMTQSVKTKDYNATTIAKVTRFHKTAHRRRKRSTTYTYNIEWEYEVNGVLYKASRHNLYLKTTISNVTEGGTAQIMYNPDNPSDSILVEETNARNGSNASWLGVTAIILIACIFQYIKS